MTREYTPFHDAARIAFLTALRDSPNVSKAARAAGVMRRTVYAARDADPAFAAAWDDALIEGIGTLEAEAHRRAFEGVDKPVFHRGQVVGSVKDFSDSLAMFLLKSHDPERYRERSEVKHAGALSITVVTGVPAEDDVNDLV